MIHGRKLNPTTRNTNMVPVLGVAGPNAIGPHPLVTAAWEVLEVLSEHVWAEPGEKTKTIKIVIKIKARLGR